MTNAATDLVGQTLGTYTLERLLGQGGFAWAFVGRDPQGTPVAIKVLKPRYAGDPQFASRFRNESETAAKLEHPNIIRIRSVAKTGELSFVGDEWTRGNYPRSFNFDPTGQFLYSCNQRADNVTVFRVSRNSGRLAFTGHYTPVGNPSSIVFLDLAKAGRSGVRKS